MDDLHGGGDAAVGARREPPERAVAVVARVDLALRGDRDAVQAALDLRIARDVGEDALRVRGRVPDAHVAGLRVEHVESARRRAVAAGDVEEERLGHVEPAVQVLDAVRVVEPLGDRLARGDLSVPEGEAEHARQALLLAVAHVELARGAEADAHRLGIARGRERGHVKPLDGRAARRVEAEDAAGLLPAVVRRGDDQLPIGRDGHAVGRGAGRGHLDDAGGDGARGEDGQRGEAAEGGEVHHVPFLCLKRAYSETTS